MLSQCTLNSIPLPTGKKKGIYNMNPSQHKPGLGIANTMHAPWLLSTLLLLYPVETQVAISYTYTIYSYTSYVHVQYMCTSCKPQHKCICTVHTYLHAQMSLPCTILALPTECTQMLDKFIMDMSYVPGTKYSTVYT